MTIRRKFFPSKPVQTEPGRSVDVTVQLHRGGSVIAAPCVIHGAHWSVTLPSGHIESEQWWEEEDTKERWGLKEFQNGHLGRLEASYQGEPHQHFYTDIDGIIQNQILEGPHFFCTHLKIRRANQWDWRLGHPAQPGQVAPPVLLGTLLGSHMTDAHWTVTWYPAHPTDNGKSSFGDYHLTAGSALYVYPVFKHTDEEEGEEGEEGEEEILTRLQATAFCGGKAVAQLTLHIAEGGYS